jgi:hypothetical protein
VPPEVLLDSMDVLRDSDNAVALVLDPVPTAAILSLFNEDEDEENDDAAVVCTMSANSGNEK